VATSSGAPPPGHSALIALIRHYNPLYRLRPGIRGRGWIAQSHQINVRAQLTSCAIFSIPDHDMIAGSKRCAQHSLHFATGEIKYRHTHFHCLRQNKMNARGREKVVISLQIKSSGQKRCIVRLENFFDRTIFLRTATNKERPYWVATDWMGVFPDPVIACAILDRLYQIQPKGESMRKKLAFKSPT
jgi:hypothetical protein